jgi:hypothetical protein
MGSDSIACEADVVDIAVYDVANDLQVMSGSCSQGLADACILPTMTCPQAPSRKISLLRSAIHQETASITLRYD